MFNFKNEDIKYFKTLNYFHTWKNPFLKSQWRFHYRLYKIKAVSFSDGEYNFMTSIKASKILIPEFNFILW